VLSGYVLRFELSANTKPEKLRVSISKVGDPQLKNVEVFYPAISPSCGRAPVVKP
jgi:hypothetical protein